VRPAFWRAKSAEPEEMFLLIWLFLPLTIFFVVRSRLGLYVLPLFAPMALLMARRVRDWTWPLGRRERVAIAIWVFCLLFIRWAGAQVPSQKDNRSWAQAIESFHPGLLDEVVWLDRRPRWGLAFYLDAEVEQVSLHPGAKGPMNRPLPTALQELQEYGEGTRLWLVRDAQVPDLLHIVRAQGFSVRKIGHYRGRTFYLLDAPPGSTDSSAAAL
jgi:hypothetical protein